MFGGLTFMNSKEIFLDNKNIYCCLVLSSFITLSCIFGGA